MTNQRLSAPSYRTAPGWELTAAQRKTLRDVGDALIPAVGDFPSATGAPDYDAWLDRCIAAREGDSELLRTTLDQLSVDGTDLDKRLRELHADDSQGRFHLISSIVAGAYLAGEPIRRLVGYPGQGRDPAKVDEAANELSDGILDPVIDRGAIYVACD